MARRHPTFRELRPAAEFRRDEQLPIDGMGDRLAQAQVPQGTPVGSKTEVGGPDARFAPNLEVGVLFEERKKQRTDAVQAEIPRLALKAQGSGVLIPDDHESQRLVASSSPMPMGVGLKAKVARSSSDKTVRPGTDESLADARKGILASHDGDFEIRQKGRVAFAEHKTNLQGTELLEPLDSRVAPSIQTAEFFAAQPREGRHDVFGIQDAPIRKAKPRLEPNVIPAFPFEFDPLRQVRNDFEGSGIDGHQGREDQTRNLQPIGVHDEAGIQLLRIPGQDHRWPIACPRRLLNAPLASARKRQQTHAKKPSAHKSSGPWQSTEIHGREEPMARLLSALLLLALLALPRSGQAQTALGRRLQASLQESGLANEVGFSVVDIASGEVHLAHRADTAMNPASNMKLVTSAAALRSLGPNFSMLTGLYGRVEGGRVADLVLRGYGDPSLRMSDLVELCSALADRGVTAVGNIYVDGSYFDDQILPPAFEQQPNEMAAFRAAVGAVVVERSSFVLRVLPGREVGAPGIVRLAGSGYFDLNSTITTSEPGAPNVIASQRALDDGRLALRVAGTIPAGILGVSYRRRVENPLVHAAHMLATALERAGIRGRRRVRSGTGPSRLPLLTSRYSAPVSQLLHRVGKNSDNFVAEMMLKVMGAERSRPGTSARGTEALQDVLVEAGVERDAATIVNGSGLFRGNAIAPVHFTKLLRFMYQQSGVRAEYLAHLAVGGVDGTLRRRLRDLPAAGIVRAKTGTLNDVISLSGYVLGPEPQQAVAFSFLANGIRGRQGAARRAADDLVRIIAADLYD